MLPLADGSIDQATYDYEKEQIELDLAGDLRLENSKSTRSSGHIAASVLIAVFIPVATGALYLQLGNPSAITQDRNAPATAGIDPANMSMEDLLPQLQQRLEQNPGDPQGWRLLGRSYLTVGEFGQASEAFERALALEPNDLPTLAQTAEAIAMSQGGQLAGKPMAYLQRASAIDNNHEHTLWLMSIAKQQTGDHEEALAGFDRLLTIADGNDEALATIEEMRKLSVAALAGDAASLEMAPDDEANSTKQTARLSVSVALSNTALQATESSNVVFIYARATDGPPMPLAVNRLTVADLPITITLDDSMAMIPGMTLSAFPSVTVGARVSASGNAIAQSGDWYTEIENVDPFGDAELDLTIDKQTP